MRNAVANAQRPNMTHCPDCNRSLVDPHDATRNLSNDHIVRDCTHHAAPIATLLSAWFKLILIPDNGTIWPPNDQQEAFDKAWKLKLTPEEPKMRKYYAVAAYNLAFTAKWIIYKDYTCRVWDENPRANMHIPDNAELLKRIKRSFAECVETNRSLRGSNSCLWTECIDLTIAKTT